MKNQSKVIVQCSESFFKFRINNILIDNGLNFGDSQNLKLFHSLIPQGMEIENYPVEKVLIMIAMMGLMIKVNSGII